MPWIASVDMYRKVPVDLLEGTRRGKIFSILAIVAMATLFILETRSFLKSTIVSDLSLDQNTEKKVKVTINVTMLDLRCDYVVVDVMSVLGTEQNVTGTLYKYNVDADGVKQRLKAINKKQRDIVLYDESVTETMEEVYERKGGEEDVVSLDKEGLEIALKENTFVFVDFFASWCSHCRDLAPTWEILAELMNDVAVEKFKHKVLGNEHHYSDIDHRAAAVMDFPLLIAKVDCVELPDLCLEQKIMAYPTLRLFLNGKRANDYQGHRTVLEMTNYLASMEHWFIGQNGDLDLAENFVQKAMGVPEHEQQKKRANMKEWHDDEHPGCQISGSIYVDRVPGYFHIMAKSNSHDLEPTMTNVSHEVHKFRVGNPTYLDAVEQNRNTILLPNDFAMTERLSPMDGNVYISSKYHEAYHHHIKLVSTNFPYKGRIPRVGRVYQMLLQSQLAGYREEDVPEAKFSFDLSPVAISYREENVKWYDYLTSIMAIIGGSFVVVGIFESSVRVISEKKRL